MKLSKLLFTFFSILLVFEAGIAGNIKFQNSISKKLYVSVAYWDGFKWVTRGWYQLNPGETQTLITNNNNQYVYWYATIDGSDTDYTGQYSFCIDPYSAFTKNRADKYCSSGEWKGFNQMNVGNYDEFTFRIVHKSKCKGNCEDGYGTYYYDNGNYEGWWKNGKEHGRGNYYWNDNGNKYVGDWKNGNLTGQGTYYWSNGDKYVGDFYDGRMNGKGTVYWTNGNKYVGDFYDGNIHGDGVYYYSDGTSKKGIWQNGTWKYHGQLHLILVVNTNDVYVGSHAEKIKNVFVDFYRKIANAGDLKFSLKVISGSNFNYSYITAFTDNFKCGANDVVVFHYFGHGGRKPSTPGQWPLMKLCNDRSLVECGLTLDYFRQILYGQTSARLGLFFADCCNIDNPDDAECIPAVARSLYSDGFTKTSVEELFVRRKGYLMASSSSVGEYSNTELGGTSLYTIAFIESLEKYLKTGSPTWHGAMDNVKSKVLGLTETCQYKTKQTPQHDLGSLKIIN